jgi:hypothetical protein
LFDKLAVLPPDKAGHQLGHERHKLGVHRDLDALRA